MKHVYVAGPLTSTDADQVATNVATALAAGERLRRAGVVPFVPHIMIYWGSEVPYESWMDYDLAWLLRCDALLRLPGDSAGADREVSAARKVGLPVFFDEVTLLEWIVTGRPD